MKQALRRLGRDRSFTSLAVLVLALGIGAVTAVFSAVNGILLQPLPYPDSSRLYAVQERIPKFLAQYPALPVNARHFDEWRKACASCDQLALFNPMNASLTGAGEPERISGVRATPALLHLLGARVRFGRMITEDDDKPGAGKVVVLSDSLWRRRFQADPGIVGRKILLDGVPYDAIGVLGPELLFPRRDQLSGLIQFPDRSEIFVPAAIDFAKVRPMGNFNFAVLAKLKPGASPGRAAEEMAAAVADFTHGAGIEVHVLVTPLKEMVTGKTERALWLLLGTVAAVLLIVCVNLGNLTLVRAHGRTRESAIRRALGASGRQVLGTMLSESLLLALAGGALGVLVAYAGVKTLVATAPVDLPRLEEVRMDAAVLAFAFLVSAACGLLFGILPALKMARSEPQEALKASSHTVTESGGRLRARNVLVGIEVALSAALLVIAALLGGSFSKLMRAERGFEVQNVLTARLSLPERRYPKDPDRVRFYDQLLATISQTPGVRSAGLSNALPLTGEAWVDLLRKEGNNAPLWELPVSNYRYVNPSYFEAMGIPLRGGRAFTEHDRTHKVAVISESAARRVWPGESAIGKRFAQNEKPKADDWIEIIGIAADVRTSGLDKPPVPIAYVPYWDAAEPTMVVVIKTAADPASAAGALRAAVREIDAELPVTKIETMGQVLAESVGQRKFQATLAVVFASAALLLACLGIYGVVSYTVARRTPEIGVRMAFGAGKPAVVLLVLKQEMMPVLAGLVAGLCIALASGRWLAGLLYGVSPRDPATMTGVSALLLAVAAAACWAPAARAARIDVTRALRYE